MSYYSSRETFELTLLTYKQCINAALYAYLDLFVKSARTSLGTREGEGTLRVV